MAAEVRARHKPDGANREDKGSRGKAGNTDSADGCDDIKHTVTEDRNSNGYIRRAGR